MTTNNDENVPTEDEKNEKLETNENKTNDEPNSKKESSPLNYTEHKLYCLANQMPNEYATDMISNDLVNELSGKEIPEPKYFHSVFTRFDYSPRGIKIEETPLCIMTMFKDLDMMRRWCIQREALARFVLIVKQGYNDNPYHNWQHGFSVAHFAYLLIKNCDLIRRGAMTHLEALAFFISAICHDLDHRGTNNGFQKKTKSILAIMHNKDNSVMEQHHLSQAVAILETDGCDILGNLTKSEYALFLEHMENIILATDIGNHFGILSDLLQFMGDDPEDVYDPKYEDHHEIVLCLMITACDLSDQTKDWNSAITAAKSVYNEFLDQGDVEKMMGFTPIEMMDRENAIVTDLQFQFVEKLALPVYQILHRIFPKTYDALRGIMINRKKWKRLQDMYNFTVEDPDETPADPTDLQGIINALEYEGAEMEY